MKGKNVLKVAITGNIASGKSQVERILNNKGFKVFDADAIAHKILDELTDFYGQDIFTNGKTDRKKLANVVFNNTDLKLKLEAIIHPKVKNEILKIFNDNQHENVIFVSVPLLFEANFSKMFDKIIFISCPEELRLQRLIKRNDLSPDEAKKRINAQMPEMSKILKSDFVIENKYTINELKQRVEEICDKLYL